MCPAAGWTRQRRSGTASSLCGPWPDEPHFGHRAIAFCHVLDEALVIGSSQPLESVSSEALNRRGIELVRRGAGGGAVLVAPRSQVWIDFWLPRRDELWDEDVVRSSWWLGALWASALGSLGAEGPLVHRGPMVASGMSRLVCFAGLGPGEVTVGGSKLVGIAQRRNRHGARFLSVAELKWEPSSIVGLLSPRCLDERRRRTAAAELAGSATGLLAALGDSAPQRPVELIDLVESEIDRCLP